MPSYRTHLAGYLALLAGVALIHVRIVGEIKVDYTLLASAAIGLLYSILPDLDTPSSLIRRYATRFLTALIFSSILMYVLHEQNTLLVFVSLLALLIHNSLWNIRHRGLMHKTGFGLALSCIPAYINPVYGLFAFFGYSSHLAFDAV